MLRSIPRSSSSTDRSTGHFKHKLTLTHVGIGIGVGIGILGYCGSGFSEGDWAKRTDTVMWIWNASFKLEA